MTLEEFNSPIWTGGIKAKYENRTYDVISVDFEFKTVVLDLENGNCDNGSGNYSISYEEIEILQLGS